MPIRTLILPIQGLDDHDSTSLEDLYVPNLRNVRSLRSKIDQAPGATAISDPPAGALVAMKTGDVLCPAVTGNQTYTHNLATVPVGYVFYAMKANEIALYPSHFMLGMGDGTDFRSTCWVVDDGTTTLPISSYASVPIQMLKADGTTLFQASFVSATSSTLTLNWTTVDSTEQWRFFFYVLGCSGASGKLREWTMNASAGNQAVTGAGFAPQGVLHFTRGPAGSTGLAAIGIGAQGPTTQGWAVGAALARATGDTDAMRFQSTDACIGIPQVSPPGGTTFVGIRANPVALGVDGFTVNVVSPPVSPRTCVSLCLAGFAGFKAGSFAKSTGAAPITQTISEIAFGPDSVIMAGFNASSTEGATQTRSDFQFSYGNCTAFRSGSNLSLAYYGQRGASPQQMKAVISRGSIGTFGELACYQKTDSSGDIVVAGQVASYTGNGFVMNWTVNDTVPDTVCFVALKATSALADTVGIIRNYLQPYVGVAGTEKVLMLTDKSAYIYVPNTALTLTGSWSPTAEVYTGISTRRFSIANTQTIAAWSQGTDNIRQYDGTTFSSLITSGTNHAARTVLAFNNRIVSVRPTVAGTDQKTQVRWSVNGNVNNWNGTGSGTVEVVETSDAPLTGGFVLAGRAYVTRAREVVELIATGSLTPVFAIEPKIPGIGCIATHSIAVGDVFAFWLGPDEVYQFDGSNVKAIGGRTYHTISRFVDYNQLDNIQGTVYTPDSQYWLLVGDYVFIYDYRRECWYWDDMNVLTAIATMNVGGATSLSGANFTGDIDSSQFVIEGDQQGMTIRVNYAVRTYLGVPIDSYFETRDFLPLDHTSMGRINRSRGGNDITVSYDRLNSVYRVWFRAIAGTQVEVGISTDLGDTYPDLRTVTVNSEGVGIAFFERAYSTVRFRFRSVGTDEYSIRAPIQYEWQASGILLPGY